MKNKEAEMEVRALRDRAETRIYLFSSVGEKAGEHHFYSCRLTSDSVCASALLEMGFSREEDHRFFQLAAESRTDPETAGELFEDHF